MCFRVLSDILAPHRKGKLGKTQPQSRSSMETADDSNSSSMTVLPSSTDLFYFYGQILEQCAKLSTGQPLFDLSTLFKKWLRIYAGKLLFSSYLYFTNLTRGGSCHQRETVSVPNFKSMSLTPIVSEDLSSPRVNRRKRELTQT